MILLAIHSRFVLVVDSMYRNSVRKICGVFANSQRLLLFDEERPAHQIEQTLKNFRCLFNPEKQHGANL